MVVSRRGSRIRRSLCGLELDPLHEMPGARERRAKAPRAVASDHSAAVVEMKVREDDVSDVFGGEADLLQSCAEAATTVHLVRSLLALREPLAEAGVDEGHVFSVDRKRAMEA